ncbi:sodium:proton antiporter [Colwellia sp. 75C3]|uniref:monovalent cation/H(+) antiporter subunit G n=1 Tax=Colwellia sp. 75C3 TaxID=888425 RepID=UPI000C34F044|nr:monovalent cation/H(+) antiporter subunit G [Colwellia sp. 75C3]PKG81653.1 sodium:proton antiporter [Colwellia sp. 75C3]
MDIIINISGALFLLIGSFLCISGGVGLLRFPDFYTRMHAVGVTDTLGAGMILIGLMFYSPDFLTFSKLVIILLLTLLIGPTTSHVLAKAAMHNNLMPKLQQEDNIKETSSSNY